MARWSNLDNETTTADADRIAAAIAYAEGEVEDRFRGGAYAVPFVSTAGAFPAVMTTWMAQIAGAWLYKNRGMLDSPSGDEQDRNRITVHEREAKRGIMGALAGSRTLQLASSATSTRPTAPVAIMPKE